MEARFYPDILAALDHPENIEAHLPQLFHMSF